MLLSFSAPVHPSFFSNSKLSPKFNPNCTISTQSKRSLFLFTHKLHSSNRSDHNVDKIFEEEAEEKSIDDGDARLNVAIGNSSFDAGIGSFRMSFGDQAFFLLAFIACTTSIAFTSLVVAAIPTLLAMKRAATSLAKLADTAREEIPSTMAAVRLSGMEISDLTLQLSDLSHEIADGVNKSAKVVEDAKAGVRQIGALAHSKTMSMIEERANLPDISIQPVVVRAAKKTSNAVGRAKKTIMNLISGDGAYDSDSEEQWQ